MKFSEDVVFEELLGHRTLLFGELNTKKTYHTAKFVQFLLEAKKISPKEISILDFAPERQTTSIGKIGGKIENFYENTKSCNVIPINGKILPPRLTATNLKELDFIASANFKLLNDALNSFEQNITSFLLINDLSMYLHIGSKMRIWNVIKKSSTFFGNSYYGESINKDFAKKFSLREKKRVNFLIKRVDFPYFIE